MKIEKLDMNLMEGSGQSKRPYTVPRLERYGSLNSLTESTMSGSTADGAGMGKSGS